MTMGSGAYIAGTRPDLDVVVVSAGFRVVVVTDVVVVGEELAEFDEQLASTNGSITTTRASGFLKDLTAKQFPVHF